MWAHFFSLPQKDSLGNNKIRFHPEHKKDILSDGNPRKNKGVKVGISSWMLDLIVNGVQ